MERRVAVGRRKDRMKGEKKEERKREGEEGTKTIRTDEERYYSNGKRYNFRGKSIGEKYKRETEVVE